eukprot:CAMPEP_0170123236 /NCGR_PEP_ID=MMETSP0020_2-20130122/17333_1 /TAXON_ID=98059 /ORGANISM="Dinobryon sp., Strain UTEXLB2267" /LENGTH=130 /DNA_ID=CAMNT_0010354683 /DNA_START=122 /DNA_END=514 /DNA_ORIENTATION=-
MSRSASTSAGSTRSNSQMKNMKCLKDVLRCDDAPTSSRVEKWCQYTMAYMRNMRVKSTLTDCRKCRGNGAAEEVGKRLVLFISLSTQVITKSTYSGPEQACGVLLLSGAHRYSNPGGKPSPAGMVESPTS